MLCGPAILPSSVRASTIRSNSISALSRSSRAVANCGARLRTSRSNGSALSGRLSAMADSAERVSAARSSGTRRSLSAASRLASPKSPACRARTAEARSGSRSLAAMAAISAFPASCCSPSCRWAAAASRRAPPFPRSCFRIVWACCRARRGCEPSNWRPLASASSMVPPRRSASGLGLLDTRATRSPAGRAPRGRRNRPARAEWR